MQEVISGTRLASNAVSCSMINEFIFIILWSALQVFAVKGLTALFAMRRMELSSVKPAMAKSLVQRVMGLLVDLDFFKPETCK